MRIRIICEAAGVDVAAELNASVTAEAFGAILPLEAAANRWGDELYFTVPMHQELDGAVAKVGSGDVGFWPTGDAVCVFFGQQPVSPVNPLGRVQGDATVFRRVDEGQTVRVEALPG